MLSRREILVGFMGSTMKVSSPGRPLKAPFDVAATRARLRTRDDPGCLLDEAPVRDLH